jgi:hypothetical protein
MYKKIPGLISIAFLLFAFPCMGQQSESVSKLLPKQGEYFNWVIKDSPEIYSGDNLYSYINGGADVYLEYGFIEVVSCKYTNYSAAGIHIEIYSMSDAAAAFGVISLSTSAKGKPLELGDNSFLYDYYLEIWKASYFIRCTASKKENGMMDTLRLFAENIVRKIEGKGKQPALTQVFNLEEMRFTNVKYIKGIIGLGNVFNFGHGAVAAFSEGVIGYNEDKMLFTFGYTDDRKCREWFASAKGKMQMNQKFTGYVQVENGFTIKDKTGTNFCFIPYKRFIIIIKGVGWEEAQTLLNQIRLNLDGI